MSLGSTGCFWAPSLFAIWCFEQAEPCFASCRLAARPILQLEAEAGSPEKPFEVSSGLTTIPPGLLPGDPTASGVDKHLQSSEKCSHLSRKHATRLGLLETVARSSWG